MADARSLLHCAVYCMARPECISLSWKRDVTSSCLLSSKDVTHDIFSKSSLENAVNWTTIVALRYPVFQAHGSAGRYKLTVDQASALCEERGTTLASRVDLLQARNLGFELCSCGWLDDGTNGLVLQSPRPLCWKSFEPDIISCGFSQVDAWCKQA